MVELIRSHLSKGEVFNFVYSQKPVINNNFLPTFETFQNSISICRKSNIEQCPTISTKNISKLDSFGIKFSTKFITRTHYFPFWLCITNYPYNLRIIGNLYLFNWIFAFSIRDVSLYLVSFLPVNDSFNNQMDRIHQPEKAKEDATYHKTFTNKSSFKNVKPYQRAYKENCQFIHSWNSFKNVVEKADDGVQHYGWIPFYIHGGSPVVEGFGLGLVYPTTGDPQFQ